MKINIKALALTCAVSWGCMVFLTTLWMYVRGLQAEPIIFEFIYPGYSISGIGSIIGLIYGFLDGLIVGAFFGWLYNYVSLEMFPAEIKEKKIAAAESG